MIKIAATIKDVAKMANVSIATVSKYINGGNVLPKNKIALESAIKELDFKINEIARGLKTNKTKTIGVLIPSLENVFFTSIVSSIENVLIKAGYSTIICDYKENPDFELRKLKFLADKLVDGMIVVPSGENIEYLKKLKMPLVLIDRLIDEIKRDTVLVDNENASYLATKNLINNGHKKIGIICGKPNIYTAKERLKGYKRAFVESNLAIDEDYIKYGDYQIQSGYDLFDEFFEMENRPTAVYTTNYEMSLGAIIAINERNLKMPQDISFIGFDNIDLAKVVRPALSIIVQPIMEIGKKAAKLLLDRLKGKNEEFPMVIKLETTLLERDSVCMIED